MIQKKIISLTEWARREGVSKMTAWRRATGGQIEGAFVNTAGRWVVEVEDEGPKRQTVAYARVSSHDQKADLDRQVARLAEWAADNHIVIDRYVREIGSGLNDKRKAFRQILSDPLVETIIVEHRDRLARFGVGNLEAALSASGRKLVVVDPGEAENELVQDMIDLMTSFSARLYGQRSARNRAKRALKELKP